MQKPIRRADRAIPLEEAIEILNKGEYGILSTVSEDGQPYGVPVSYSYVDDALYFHCAMEGHKLENLATDNRVSFCVVGQTEVLPDRFTTRYESAIVFGKAIEMDGNEKLRGLSELVKKYSPDHLEEGQLYIKTTAERTRVYKIMIELLTGKSRK
jgi:nitroimidazol reductase NimA-like FMN-containing flavoprotein (pyridoxamine 5'-phosphate oxidase superfamily)